MRTYFTLGLIMGLLVAAPSLGWLFADEDAPFSSHDLNSFGELASSLHNEAIVMHSTLLNGETRQSVIHYLPNGRVLKNDRYRPDPKAPWQETPQAALASSSASATPPPPMVRHLCGRCGRCTAAKPPSPRRFEKPAAAPAPPSLPTACQRLKQELHLELQSKMAPATKDPAGAVVTASRDQAAAGWKVGDPVAAYWDETPSAHGWYTGRVSSVNDGDGTLGVIFDDGDSLDRVPNNRVKALSEEEIAGREDEIAKHAAATATRENKADDTESSLLEEEEVSDERATDADDEAEEEEEDVSTESQDPKKVTTEASEDEEEENESEEKGDADVRRDASTAGQTPSGDDEVDYDSILKETLQTAPPRPKGERREWSTRQGWGRREDLRAESPPIEGHDEDEERRISLESLVARHKSIHKSIQESHIAAEMVAAEAARLSAKAEQAQDAADDYQYQGWNRKAFRKASDAAIRYNRRAARHQSHLDKIESEKAHLDQELRETEGKLARFYQKVREAKEAKAEAEKKRTAAAAAATAARERAEVEKRAAIAAREALERDVLNARAEHAASEAQYEAVSEGLADAQAKTRTANEVRAKAFEKLQTRLQAARVRQAA